MEGTGGRAADRGADRRAGPPITDFRRRQRQRPTIRRWEWVGKTRARRHRSRRGNANCASRGHPATRAQWRRTSRTPWKHRRSRSRRTTFLHAIDAGWIIALLVWVFPGAEYDKVAVIVVMTWLIAAGGFAHVIAGSSEVFYSAWRGEASWADALARFVLPSLLGNMLGGLTLVTALNHAQATAGE